ncbi:hypothetical protein AAFF_G00064770 [Aldrovandia affinis]|uniref:NTR domain-containing protein n=1 Tax=Aldrovandia affinis TaxID=143900 RepID=A0AAD7WZI0_9TELE|nr:hypothetical protein AAFF_G00064770 [Aldrovandia affinis]
MNLLPLLCLFHAFGWAGAQNKIYLITAPKILRLDAAERVVIQLFGYEQDSTFTVSLKSYPDKKQTFATESVKLTAEKGHQGVVTLRLLPTDLPKNVNSVYLEAQSGDLTSEEKLLVSRDNGFLFIQTDKPLYTPEQSVKVRVFSLNAELKPAQRPVTLTFLDPEAVTVDIVNLIDVSGILSMQNPFRIPLKPKFGVWKIEATYTEDFITTATAEFEVKEYVLPSIAVIIQPDVNYISTANFESFKLTVTARYIHGLPVANAHVYLRFGYIEGSITNILPESERRDEIIDGEVKLVLNIKKVMEGLPNAPYTLQELEGKTFYISVTVQETTGGISQEAELATVKFCQFPYTLGLISTPPFIKPGLPYSIRVQVKDPLGHPVQSIPVKATALLTKEDGESGPLDHSDQKTVPKSLRDGTTLFFYNLPSDSKTATFMLETADSALPPTSQAKLRYTAEAYKSSNKRYLYINWASHYRELQVGDYASINIHFYFHQSIPLRSFSYQIISKGKIVKFKTVPLPNNANVQGINFLVTPDMAPSARLLVYYIMTGENRAELVADSVWMGIKAKCVNDLKTTLWATEELYRPKDSLPLKVKAGHNSLVAFSSIDTAIYNLRDPSGQPMGRTLHHIEQSDQGCGGGGGKDNADVFRLAGLTFITNANAKATLPEDESCSAVLRPKRAINFKEELIKKGKLAQQYKASLFQTSPCSILEYGNMAPCCYVAMSSIPTLETCELRAQNLRRPNQITDYERCKDIFTECCRFHITLTRDETSSAVLRHKRAMTFKEKLIKKDETSSAVLRHKRAMTFKEKLIKKVMEYGKHMAPCCYVALSRIPTLESCGARAQNLRRPDQIPDYERCKDIFTECCQYYITLDAATNTHLSLGRMGYTKIHIELVKKIPELGTQFGAASPRVRSFFPESWLWEVHSVTDRSGLISLPKYLPDSLTTWEIKAVEVSTEGICVADPLRVQVNQMVSVDVPMPYSMVRGEQIELRGSVYNQLQEESWFCVTLTAPRGVCLFQARATADGASQSTPCIRRTLQKDSVSMVTFTLMALEAGEHRLNFSLLSTLGSETVVKTLRVVPEGIKTEVNVGGTLDPQGVYGHAKRKLQFQNSIPLNLVPKSSMDRLLTVNGEMVGAVMAILNDPQGVRKLTSLPRGSAEVELMGVLPVYYVYHYLEMTSRWTLMGADPTGSRMDLRRKLREGMTSLMSFRKKNEHSYSMWANKDSSTWLTALVVKVLGQVEKYEPVDRRSLCNSIFWLKSMQNVDGSFREQSSYIPTKIMGAGADVMDRTAFLTSFTIIGIKTGMEVKECGLQEFKDVLNKAVKYLFHIHHKLKSMYVQAITAYALALVDHSSMPARELYGRLQNKAIVKGNPAVFRFWQEESAIPDASKPSKVSAQSVETTVYMLLTAMVYGHIPYANPILNWLTQDQRYGGGFHSTQDTILTLEALTKYSLLVEHAELNMEIRASYRNKGDLQHIILSEKHPMAKPIQVTLDDDVIVATGLSTGVSVANMKTVYYRTTHSNDTCYFDLTIQVHSKSDSRDPMLLSPRIVACAKYKPPENEVFTESSHAVMEIHLPTGVQPFEEDLDHMLNSLESRISNYEIQGDQVVIQLDTVPSEDFLCVGFRIQELFRTSLTSSSLFRVYEYHSPESQCSKLYYPYGKRKLLRFCEGEECLCMAAECSSIKPPMDVSITEKERLWAACQDHIKYAFKAKIKSFMEEGDFVSYEATIEQVYKKGTLDIRKDTDVTFVKKATCSDLLTGSQYLIMGSEVMQILVNRKYKYKYLLDSQTWVEKWPQADECTDSPCTKFEAILEEFAYNFQIYGCLPM